MLIKNKRLVAEIINGEEVIMTIDSNMLHCEFGSLDRGNITDTVNWGIYSNRGSISFVDNLGYFKENSKDTNKKYVVAFYLCYGDIINRKKVSKFNTESISLDDETKIVEIQLISRLSELQQKKASLAGLSVVDASCSAWYLLGLEEDVTDSWGYYKSFQRFVSNGEEDREWLEETRIKAIYFPPMQSAWDRLSQVCQATMGRIIEDQDGNAIISSEKAEKSPIIVKPQNIISISKPYSIGASSYSIDIKDASVYIDKKLENFSKEIKVNYDELGDIISISNADFKISDWITDLTGTYKKASGTINISTPYKFLSTYQTIITTEHEIENDLGQKGYYDTVEVWGGATISGNEKDSLTKKYDFNVVEKSSDRINRVKSVNFEFWATYIEDVGSTTIDNREDYQELLEEPTNIPSNSLIQTGSSYSTDGVKTPLGNHILQEASRRFGKGIECFEIECLFNSYYYEDGTLAFDGEKLSNHFEKYDVIIPYTIRKGKTVPLRENEDGTPKKFRIIGISYSYDGLLKQKLSVQEDRYDVD